MNSDQLNSLIRTALKVIGGILLSHDLTNAAGVVNSPDFIGGVFLIVGVLWSHFSHATPPTSSSGPSNPGAPLMVLLHGGALFFSGCSTTPQQAAYQGAGTTVVSVDTAMKLWGAYVASNHPGTNTEAAVKSAYEKYQASMAVVCDAGAAYSATGGTNATATAALQQAVENSGQEIVDLENLISSFGVKLQ
jgi:hypothetical protein